MHAGELIKDMQHTLEFLFDQRELMSELDVKFNKWSDTIMKGDMEDAADNFRASEKALKGCKGRFN